VIGADEVGAAYERLRAGDVRFRFVIDISTLNRQPSSAVAASLTRP